MTPQTLCTYQFFPVGIHGKQYFKCTQLLLFLGFMVPKKELGEQEQRRLIRTGGYETLNARTWRAHQCYGPEWQLCVTASLCPWLNEALISDMFLCLPCNDSLHGLHSDQSLQTSALSLLPVIFSLKPGSQFDGWTEGWAAGQRQLRQTAIQGCCWNYSSTFAFTLFRLLHFTLKNYFVESYLSKLKNDKKSSFCFVSLNYFIGLKVFHWTLHTNLGIVGIKEV